MSRIGKKPIPLPAGVKYTVRRQHRARRRPQGQSHRHASRRHHARPEGRQLIAERENDKQAAFHGLARALVFNAVTGVTTG